MKYLHRLFLTAVLTVALLSSAVGGFVVAGEEPFPAELLQGKLLSASVSTKAMADGSLTRSIRLLVPMTVEQAVNDAGHDLEAYFQKLCTGDTTLTRRNPTTGGYVDYVFAVTASSAEELCQKTDAVFQTQGSAFSVTVSPNDDTPGVVSVTVTEKLDGSFYLNPTFGACVQSSLWVYGAQLTYEDDEAPEEEYLLYSAAAGEEYHFAGMWVMGCESVKLKAKANGLDKLTVSLAFQFPKSMDKALLQSAGKAIELAAEKGGELKIRKNVYTVTFKGAIDDVSKAINRFVAASEEVPSDTLFFEVSLNSFTPRSRMRNGAAGSMTYDFSPVLKGAPMRVENKGGTYYAVTGGSSSLHVPAAGRLNFYSSAFSVKAAVLLSVFAVAFLLGGVLLWLFLRRGKHTAPESRVAWIVRVSLAALVTVVGVVGCFVMLVPSFTSYSKTLDKYVQAIDERNIDDMLSCIRGTNPEDGFYADSAEVLEQVGNLRDLQHEVETTGEKVSRLALLEASGFFYSLPKDAVEVKEIRFLGCAVVEPEKTLYDYTSVSCRALMELTYVVDGDKKETHTVYFNDDVTLSKAIAHRYKITG